MDRSTQEKAKVWLKDQEHSSKVWLLQRDYQKAIKEVKRLAELLKDVGILVD